MSDLNLPYRVIWDYDPRYAELVKTGQRVDFLPDRPVLVAAFSRRDDAHLFAGIRAGIRSGGAEQFAFCDGITGYTIIGPEDHP
jgi:hypothetical protein